MPQDKKPEQMLTEIKAAAEHLKIFFGDEKTAVNAFIETFIEGEQNTEKRNNVIQYLYEEMQSSEESARKSLESGSSNRKDWENAIKQDLEALAKPDAYNQVTAGYVELGSDEYAIMNWSGLKVMGAQLGRSNALQDKEPAKEIAQEDELKGFSMRLAAVATYVSSLQDAPAGLKDALAELQNTQEKSRLSALQTLVKGAERTNQPVPDPIHLLSSFDQEGTEKLPSRHKITRAEQDASIANIIVDVERYVKNIQQPQNQLQDTPKTIPPEEQKPKNNKPEQNNRQGAIFPGLENILAEALAALGRNLCYDPTIDKSAGRHMENTFDPAAAFQRNEENRNLG